MKKKEKFSCISDEKSCIGISVIKVFIRVVFITILISNAEIAQAQQSKVTIQKENVSIEAILQEIQKQTGMTYLMNHEAIPEGTKVSVEVKDVSVEEILDRCLKGLPITYQIKKNVIVIVPISQKNSRINSGKKIVQTIRGRVLDKESNISLPGANIILENSDPIIGCISDEEGYFRLENVPMGRHTLRISFVGYEELILPEIVVGSAKEVILTLKLVESAEDITEVVVRPAAKGEPKNEMAMVSARSFSVEESERYASGLSDPGRIALSFAGVNTQDDLSNQIVVRGNTPNGMIWRVEGVQIPVPNHFYEEGYDPGYVSILSSNMMGSTDFYTGAFPAEYGNGNSGVLDISLRNGNNEQREYAFEAGVLGIATSLEGPFSNNYKGSYLINARYSTFAIMNYLGFGIDESMAPEYTDLSCKINLPTKKIGNFSLWGLGGIGLLKEEPEPDTSHWIYSYDNYGDITKTKMGAAGLTHTISPDSKSYFKTVISYSGNSSDYESYVMDSSYVKTYDMNENLSSSALRLSILYNRKLSAKLTARTGFIFSKQYFDYSSKFLDTNDVWINDLDGNGNTETYQGYFQLKYKINDKFHVNGGVHLLNLALNGEYSIEPRFGMKWFLRNSQTISAGFGVHSRHELPIRYFIKVPDENGEYYFPNKYLKLSKANHFVLGYSKTFMKDFRFVAEVYYQHLYDVPVAPDSMHTYTSLSDDALFSPLVSEGVGRNYGIELTLEKFFTHNYYFIVNQSIYNAEYKPLDGKWYNSKYNNNYITSATGGKEFRINNKNILGLNLRFLWSGGKRGTPAIMDLSGEYVNFSILDEKQRNSIKYADYLRLDLGIKYRINNPKVSHEFSIDIQNVTNRLNIANVYNFVDEDGQEYSIPSTLQEILPVIRYKIEF